MKSKKEMKEKGNLKTCDQVVFSTDGSDNYFSRNIISSTYINFLFGSGVNGNALAQLNKFEKTIEKTKKLGGDCTNGLESGIDSLNTPEDRESVADTFKNEFNCFESRIDYENDSIKHIEELLQITYQYVNYSQNRTPAMKQINIYTLNYDEIIEHSLHKLGYMYNCISSSNTNTKFPLMNVIGYDYVSKKFIPTFMISKLHGGKDNPIIPGKSKYREVLTAEYFEIAFNMKQHLSRSNSVLFVIGYSGHDDHINELIKDCMNAGLTVYWYLYNNNDKIPDLFFNDQIFTIKQKDEKNLRDTTLNYCDDIRRVWDEKLEK